jgi:hypothetical protein
MSKKEPFFRNNFILNFRADVVLVGLLLQLEHWKAKTSSRQDHWFLSVNKICSTAHGIAVAAVGLQTVLTMSLVMEVLTQQALILMRHFKDPAGIII